MSQNSFGVRELRQQPSPAVERSRGGNTERARPFRRPMQATKWEDSAINQEQVRDLEGERAVGRGVEKQRVGIIQHSISSGDWCLAHSRHSAPTNSVSK